MDTDYCKYTQGLVRRAVLSPLLFYKSDGGGGKVWRHFPAFRVPLQEFDNEMLVVT